MCLQIMKNTQPYAALLAACLTCSQAAGEQALNFPPLKEAREKNAQTLPGRQPIGNKLFYLPTRDEPATPANWGCPYREVELISKDGTRLHGWWIVNKGAASRGTVVFSHGTAGSMGHHLGFVIWLVKAGYEVLIYDYRGYGQSKGITDRRGMIQDARAALEYAGNQRRPGGQLVISYGHSLGGAKSVAAIAEGETPKLRAVITDATFASYRQMARFMGGKLAADLVSDELSPVDHIAKISPIPLLIIHGKKDPVVPFSQAEKLFEAAKKPKTLFEVKDGHHGNSLWQDKGAYRKRMLEWLDENLEGKEKN